MLIHLLEMVTPFSMAVFPPSLQPVGPWGPALAPVSSGPCWGWTEQINVPLPLSPVLSKLVKRQQIHRDCPAPLFPAARGLLESKILQNPAFAARLQAMGTSLSCSQHPRLQEFTSQHLICSICPFISAQTRSLSAPEAADKNILLFFKPLLCKIFLVFFCLPRCAFAFTSPELLFSHPLAHTRLEHFVGILPRVNCDVLLSWPGFDLGSSILPSATI